MKFQTFLTRPETDRFLAFLAASPFFFVLWHLLTSPELFTSLPVLVYVIDCVLFLVTMLARRAPTRVTANPLYWLLTLLASYWGMLSYLVVTTGHPVVSTWLSNGLAVLGATMYVWARWSLGRNIGLVPSERQIVVSGPYRYVRHPIYLGVFVTLAAAILQNYSLTNLIYFGLGAFWFLLKSFAEEDFLRHNSAYAAYMRQVRSRWIPFLV